MFHQILHIIVVAFHDCNIYIYIKSYIKYFFPDNSKSSAQWGFYQDEFHIFNKSFVY